MGFSVATLDRLKPPARDPRKATWCGAFLTLLGVPGALAVASFFIVKAELASPVISESTTQSVIIFCRRTLYFSDPHSC